MDTYPRTKLKRFMSEVEFDDLNIGVEESYTKRRVKNSNNKKPNAKDTFFSCYFSLIKNNPFAFVLCVLFTMSATMFFSFSQAVVLKGEFILIFLVVLLYIGSTIGAIAFNRKIVNKMIEAKKKYPSMPIIHLLVILLTPIVIIVLFLIVLTIIKPESALLCGGLLPFILGIIFYLLILASTFIQKLDYYITRIDETLSKLKKKK